MKQTPLALQAAQSKFETAREALGGFRTQHARLLEEYDALRDAYNSALADVKALYKQHHEIVGAKFGEFSARTNTIINAEKLLELMGPVVDPILEIKYSVDRKGYADAVERGIIPQSVINQVESRSAPIVYGPKEQ